MRLLFLLASLASPSFAQGPTISLLPREICQKDDFGNNVVWPRDVKDTRDCLLFAEGANVYSVMLNSVLTSVYLESEQDTEGPDTESSVGSSQENVFLTSDKATKIVLKATVKGTTCRPDSESCCGDSYEGTLTISNPVGRTVVPIEYYRGG